MAARPRPLAPAAPLDVAVVGGGPAGLAAALILRRAGARVSVFERSAYDRWRPGESLASEVLEPLEELGIAQHFQRLRLTPRLAVASAWGSASLVERPAILDVQGPGWHVDRVELDRMLADAVEGTGVAVERTASVLGVERRPAGLRLRVRTGDRIRLVRARTLIDATGRRAVIARQLGAEWCPYDRLTGLTGILPGGGEDAGHRLLVEAVASGWWYAAPLAGGRLALSLLTDGDLLRAPVADRGRLWLRRLGETEHAGRLAGDRAPARLFARSAATGRLRPLFGPDWIAAGEAAVALDPLTGVGVPRALQSGIAAARAWLAREGGDQAGPARYQERTLATFGDYMLQRRAVYQQERRWPEALFWRRRHAAAAPEAPVTLGPTENVQLASRSLAESAAAVESLLPLADARLLLELCRLSRPAHQILTAFRTRARGGCDDQTAVAALQALVEGSVAARSR